jgi:hypothetical protein
LPLEYVFSVESYYLEKETNLQLARTHHYATSDGAITAGGLPDPKDLRIGSIRYRLHRSSKWRSDPSLLFPEGHLRTFYKLWRRVKCKLLGR